tara:strand:+ start:167 stop:307 length:141 start_codon:yes stop_codon:yes gene_type:complete
MEERTRRKIRKVAKALTKASRSHAGQSRTLKTLARKSRNMHGKKKK